MSKRFVSIWFRHLTTDWFTLRQPGLRELPFVVSTPSHGHMMIVATNALAEQQGVYNGMVLADARALIPSLQVYDEKPGLEEKLTQANGGMVYTFCTHRGSGYACRIDIRCIGLSSSLGW